MHGQVDCSRLALGREDLGAELKTYTILGKSFITAETRSSANYTLGGLET
jgi:hypothetical protein